MLPVYWQGSVIGAVMGLIVIAVFVTWLIRSKAEWLVWFTKRTRWLTAVSLPLIWLLTFVNIGIHNVEGDRASFDQVGKLVDKDIPKVTRDTLSPESVKKAAEESRKEIDAGNLNK
jgi:hypothetical protein